MRHISELIPSTGIPAASGLERGVSLAPLTTWRIGGPAELFWEADAERLPEVLAWCHNHEVPVRFLGRGSNVLIDDAGLSGLVISTRKLMKRIWFEDGLIHAEAGVTMPVLSRFAASLGYGGYEYLIGIPGSVGAGIAINAGLTAKGRREIADVLVNVDLLDAQGKLLREDAVQLEMGYRCSNIGWRGLVVTAARFKPTYEASAEDITHRTAEHLAERRRKQPLTKHTAGSTFKQPEGGKAAGWYIETAGMKGARVGDAVVSELHANWIVNEGSATSRDVRDLMNQIVERVFEVHGVELKPEVMFLP
jgi:UDP-N-acetylmuramate dehydrogenase